MQAYEVKKLLNTLIDSAYPDDPLRKKYRYFRIELHPDRALLSKHGDYNAQTHVIRIFNMYRDAASLTVTVLHEAAHHIDWCRNGSVSHGPEFYRAFRELLYAALDRGMLDRQDLLDGKASDASGYRNVLKMIMEYRGKEQEKTSDAVILAAKPGADRKDLVKKRGYRYHAAAQEWQKAFDRQEAGAEQDWLKENQVKSEIRDAARLDLTTGVYIFAGGGTFPYREQLKRYGFRFDGKAGNGKGCWKKVMQDSREMERYRKAMPELSFRAEVMQAGW